MRSKLFTQDETVLCAYAAMYDENDLCGLKRIAMVESRSEASIKHKIQNLVEMLAGNGIEYFSNYKPATGARQAATPPRETYWEEILPYFSLTRREFKRKCYEILAKS